MENILGTIKEFIIGIFDFIREILEGVTQPFNALLAVVLPFLAAIALAILTSSNLTKLMGMNGTEAKIYAFIFEGLAMFVFTQLVVAIVSWVKSKNEKTNLFIWLLGGLATFYMIVVIAVNVSLQYYNDVKGIDIFIYFLLSMMTPITGIAYGYYLLVMKDNKEHVDNKNHAEEIRLEKVAEKKRQWNLKHGFGESASTPAVVFQSNITQENIEEKVVKVKHGSDYKERVLKILDEAWETEKKVLTPAQITERLNKKYKLNLVHGNVKSFWSKTTSDWKQEKGIQ